jgi:hypothetical protein
MASLEDRARGAYERALVARAARDVWPAALLVPLALALHGPAHSPSTVAIAGVALVAALFALGWRAGAWRRGALAGVVAGLPPFLVPSLYLRSADCAHACARHPAPDCALACALAALLAGLVLATRARHDRDPLGYALGGALTGALTASLTCALAGGVAVAGAAVGLALGAAPALVARR